MYINFDCTGGALCSPLLCEGCETRYYFQGSFLPSEEGSTKLIAVKIQDHRVFVQPAGRFGSQP